MHESQKNLSNIAWWRTAGRDRSSFGVKETALPSPGKGGECSGQMNLDLLIDSIVRQTTVLVAQLATATGGRSPLAHTANQVMGDLIRELKEQGLGNKVIADMFGLTLRTYHNRVRRLSESTTFKGRSLWEAVLSYVKERGSVRRADILRRFARDDDRIVKAVLSDLVDSGIVFRSGRGDHTTYRAAGPDELPPFDERQRREGLEHLLTVTVSRFGPLGRAGLLEHLRLPEPIFDGAMAELVSSGRVRTVETERGIEYTCDECVIPFEEPAGWEAAVFDHYQAMVTAVCIKLRRGKLSAALADSVGGSTYTFDIWEGHPFEREILGLLSAFRQQGRALRERVDRYNEEHGGTDGTATRRELRVISYVGQGVLGLEREEGDVEW
jgi:Winged helix DNA-binding domain